MKYALINCNLLDGNKDMVAKKGYKILINNEIIEEATAKDIDLSGYKIIDMQNQYVMPGLVNLHVHLPSSGKPKKKPTDPVKLVHLLTSNALLRRLVLAMCESLAKKELYSGVTTMRTVGGVLDVDTRIRNRINSKKVLGPRILAANMAISVPGGHMADSLAYSCKDENEARELVRKIASEGTDLIKLMITGGVLDAKVKGEPGELKMDPKIVYAACDEAHKLGLKVAAHVESPKGVEVALKNGVDTIEHGAKPNDEIIELFKEKHAAHITTVSPALPFALFDRSISNVSPMEQYNGDVVFKGIIECAKACLENDIPVGLGTDTGCPYITHYDMWREINYFNKYVGVSKANALYTATLGNAKIVGLDKEIGSIEAGKLADIIVCKNNPLDNISSLRSLSYVIKSGHIIKNPRVKKMKNVERELDKFI